MVGGSPPRLWGMLGRWSPVVPVDRFTPTPVGNAPCRRQRADGRSVHPHACGECTHDAGYFQIGKGSPPRLWGMRRCCARSQAFVRFTPTPVGNARRPHRPASGYPVHPHACGECPAAPRARPLTRGSPPRLWGMQCFFYENAEIQRFTPTPVGNAKRIFGRRCKCAVHPHACGECLSSSISSVSSTGSPPRLWGMRFVRRDAHCFRRFTPTPVGNAPVTCSRSTARSVHPHACGECASRLTGKRTPPGSPPRLWGMQCVPV